MNDALVDVSPHLNHPSSTPLCNLSAGQEANTRKHSENSFTAIHSKKTIYVETHNVDKCKHRNTDWKTKVKSL